VVLKQVPRKPASPATQSPARAGRKEPSEKEA
jgi:hypothetical protein